MPDVSVSGNGNVDGIIQLPDASVSSNGNVGGIILYFISHNSARNGRSRESESARKSLLAWF